MSRQNKLVGVPTGEEDSVGQEQTKEQDNADTGCAGLRCQHLPWEQWQRIDSKRTQMLFSNPQLLVPLCGILGACYWHWLHYKLVSCLPQK